MIIWRLVFNDAVHYFTSIALCQETIDNTYSEWTSQPEIQVKQKDYQRWKPADNSLIEAFAIDVKDESLNNIYDIR